MPSLKETIESDIDVVLDFDDFAETAIVEGERIKVQFDSDRLAELSGYTQLGIGTEAVVMYARTCDLPKRRKPGGALKIGAYDWTVLSWEDRAGISEVALQRSQ